MGIPAALMSRGIVALVVASGAFYGGWTVRDWKAGHDDADRARVALRDINKRERRYDSLAASFERYRAQQEAAARQRRKEAQHVVESNPVVYHVECLDDDGLRLIADAINERSAPSVPAPALPASAPADE